MAFASPGLTSSRMCELCPIKEQTEAQMHCVQCKINLCYRCLTAHRKTPMLKGHKYVDCDFEEDSPKPNNSYNVTMELINKTISNVEKEEQKMDKNKSPRRDGTKILESISGLEEMLGELQMSSKPWTVRHVRKSMKAVLENMKHVKTAKKLQGEPYRISRVDKDIWIRSGKNMDKIDIYDKKLAKVKKLSSRKYWREDINSIQQVNNTDVFVATKEGLFLCNTKGKVIYTVASGVFTDVCVDSEQVMAVDNRKQQVIYVVKEDNKWNQQHHFTLNGSMKYGTKTLHTVCDDVFVCGPKIQQYSRDVMVKEIGYYGEDVGEFNRPSLAGSDSSGHLIICDCNNHRIQLIDLQGGCEQFVIDGVQYPRDILVIDDIVIVLHGNWQEEKLSKFEIKK